MLRFSFTPGDGKSFGLSVLTVLLALCSVPAAGQGVPAVPPAPVAPVAPAAPGLAGKCAACMGGIGGFFSSCKHKCCNSPLGSLINGAFQPLEFATGGVIPTPCPGPNDPQGNAGGPGGAGGPPGPQQAAEAIKQDQAQAKARAEAVRYLGTVPCHYYPEAEIGLITALRADRSECVRWEAAHALAQGCCCTKRTIEALKITAEGSQKDGNPAEISLRVRVEAMNALQHCLALCGEAIPEPTRPESPAPGEPEPIPTPPRPETPVETRQSNPQGNPVTPAVRLASYYETINDRPASDLLAEARQLVSSVRPAADRQATPGGKSLMELWQRSGERPPAAGYATAESLPQPKFSNAPSAGPGPVPLPHPGALRPPTPDEFMLPMPGEPTLAAPAAPTEQAFPARRLPPVSVLRAPSAPSTNSDSTDRAALTPAALTPAAPTSVAPYSVAPYSEATLLAPVAWQPDRAEAASAAPGRENYGTIFPAPPLPPSPGTDSSNASASALPLTAQHGFADPAPGSASSATPGWAYPPVREATWSAARPDWPLAPSGSPGAAPVRR